PHWLRALSVKRNYGPRFLQAMGHVLPGWQAVNADDHRPEGVDLGDPTFLAKIMQAPLTTWCGWRIASWPLVEEQQADLRILFQPEAAAAALADAYVEVLRHRYDMLIGVFIRQTDYLSWADGRFFFPPALYGAWMRQVR